MCMEYLQQRFPMLLVDRFILPEDGGFYIGVKNWGGGFYGRGTVPLTLLMEGMGQTVEYNMFKKLLAGEGQKPRLYLAGAGKVELLREVVCGRVFYRVESIQKVSNFYTSLVEVLEENFNGRQGPVIASGTIVHGV